MLGQRSVFCVAEISTVVLDTFLELPLNSVNVQQVAPPTGQK